MLTPTFPARGAKIDLIGNPSSGAMRHLLPQGEKGRGGGLAITAVGQGGWSRRSSFSPCGRRWSKGPDEGSARAGQLAPAGKAIGSRDQVRGDREVLRGLTHRFVASWAGAEDHPPVSSHKRKDIAYGREPLIRRYAPPSPAREEGTRRRRVCLFRLWAGAERIGPSRRFPFSPCGRGWLRRTG